MRRRTQYGITVAVLVVCGLAESAGAYYSPRQGRFLNRDPIGEQGGLNLYSYTRNSPPARYDPLGQDDQPNPGPPAGWSRKLDRGPYYLREKRQPTRSLSSMFCRSRRQEPNRFGRPSPASS